MNKRTLLGQIGLLAIVMALAAGAIGLVIVDTIFGSGNPANNSIHNFTGIPVIVIPFVGVFFALGLMMLGGSIGTTLGR